MPELIGGYVPVIHEGYIAAFNRHPDTEIGVFDETIIKRFDYLRKDIRALSPETVARLLEGIGRRTHLIGYTALGSLLKNSETILFDDDISRQLLRDHPEHSAQLEPVFLRWDRENSSVDIAVTPDRSVALKDNDPIVIALYNEASRSSNWWRHVAAATVHNGEVTYSYHNSSMPTEYSSTIDSDPRITAKRGEAIERSIDIHAEARLIANLARQGQPANGQDIFVTTFPCQNCAKLIAESGFRSCYFVEGYATLDGQDILKSAGVELVKVETKVPPTDPRRLRSYPTD